MERTALLLIDIQNDYFTDGSIPLPGSEKAYENARLILHTFRLERMPVDIFRMFQ